MTFKRAVCAVLTIGVVMSTLLYWQPSDVRAYSNSCIDFQVTGYLEGPDNGTHGVNVAIYRSVNVAGGGAVRSSMAFGDGSNDTILTGSGFAERTANHTYSSPGDYTIFATFKGWDQFGAWSECEDSYVIHIQ
jgi:hypothetical protein